MLSSCSKDTDFEFDNEPPIKCNFRVNTVQVSVTGRHIIQGFYNKKDECSKDQFIFDKKYGGTDNNSLIEYKQYVLIPF